MKRLSFCWKVPLWFCIVALCCLFAHNITQIAIAADAPLSTAAKQRLMQVNVPLYLERLGIQDYVLSGEGEGFSSAGQSYYLRYISPDDALLGVSLSIGSDGRLVSFSRERQGPITSEQARLPKYSLRDAAEIARQFCQKVMPETDGQLGEPKTTLDSMKQGYVVFPRLYRGIPVYREQVSVTVDLNCGEVIGSTHWYQSFEDSGSRTPQPKITLQDAIKALQKNLNLELRYETVYHDSNQTSQLMLQYGWSNTTYYGAFLDADSSELVLPTPTVSPNPGEYLNPPRYGWGVGQSLSEDELQTILQGRTLFSIAEAESLLGQMPGIDLTGMTRSSEAYYWNGSRLGLSLHFSEAEKDEQTLGIWYDATFDHDSRTLLSFSRSSPDYDSKASSKSAAELQQQAEAFLKLAHPDLAASMALDTSFQAYTIEGRTETPYYRLVQGLPYRGDRATMTWDDHSGALINYYGYPLSEQTFPSPLQVVPLQQAADALLERYPLKLYYMLPDMYLSPENRMSPVKPRLVYSNEFLYDAYVNAQNGEVKLRYTPTEAPQAPEYTDLDDIADSEAILLTASYLQLPAWPEFRPREIVTQAEFLSWIYMLDYWAQPGMDIDAVYNNLGHDIIAKTEIDHEKPLTFLEGITYLLRKLNYSRFTVLRGAYQNPHNLDDRSAAYVALAKGLHLIDTKSFAPDATMSRAEAIMLLYRYLAR